MSFTSVTQLASGISVLIKEFNSFFKNLYLFRLLRYFCRKLRVLLYRLCRQEVPQSWLKEDPNDVDQPKNTESKENDEDNEQIKSEDTQQGQDSFALFFLKKANTIRYKTNGSDSTSSPNMNPPNTSLMSTWISVGFFVFGILWILQIIWNAHTQRLEDNNSAPFATSQPWSYNQITEQDKIIRQQQQIIQQQQQQLLGDFEYPYNPLNMRQSASHPANPLIFPVSRRADDIRDTRVTPNLFRQTKRAFDYGNELNKRFEGFRDNTALFDHTASHSLENVWKNAVDSTHGFRKVFRNKQNVNLYFTIHSIRKQGYSMITLYMTMLVFNIFYKVAFNAFATIIF
ncbi:hypothetical protein RFI_23716 [Reticulomyxa filosa]|uniref:Peroxin 13 N-terminal domain-containing protein n=1 Tax=Reticulomyxa filosa TaxID=46433 RepID=X6MIE7_RETFI|nr:hypothetical protein RFI_23716 [Reticulomyxa filosa]|eukprot:ETO13654.1 hypothetical protein RFI_23716 [Reticulomyxa filosa]